MKWNIESISVGKHSWTQIHKDKSEIEKLESEVLGD